MEDRCNHLSKVKGKLEQSLDETEDALEREKKSKGDVEKLKRKIEGDLKLTQEAVGDLDRIKADLAAGLQRKARSWTRSSTLSARTGPRLRRTVQLCPVTSRISAVVLRKLAPTPALRLS